MIDPRSGNIQCCAAEEVVAAESPDAGAYYAVRHQAFLCPGQDGARCSIGGCAHRTGPVAITANRRRGKDGSTAWRYTTPGYHLSA